MSTSTAEFVSYTLAAFRGITIVVVGYIVYRLLRYGKPF